ncbi:hypothetical protein BRADI_3g08883v3 [Brachypodium distachyon]|uniref:Uncharacterized protein n=1 Tax=Brachypodium distachyon TaxID=15368 RepID=A0A0Q3PXI5_BRADI|nr:hypothetical protein BRADI_3g08883v3 [Brachypodium distachyon]
MENHPLYSSFLRSSTCVVVLSKIFEDACCYLEATKIMTLIKKKGGDELSKEDNGSKCQCSGYIE